MKNPHLLSIPRAAALPSHLLVLDHRAGGSQPDGPAPAWLRSSLRWLVWNSPLPVPEKCILQRRLQDPYLSQCQALALQQQIIAQVHAADLARKTELRARFVQRLVRHADLFRHTHRGRDMVRATLTTLQDETATWEQLERADERTDTLVELYHDAHSWLHS